MVDPGESTFNLKYLNVDYCQWNTPDAHWASLSAKAQPIGIGDFHSKSFVGSASQGEGRQGHDISRDNTDAFRN